MTREQNLLHQLECRVKRWICKNTGHDHTFSFDPAIVIPEHETYEVNETCPESSRFNMRRYYVTRPGHITHVRVSGVTLCACILEGFLSCSCCAGSHEYFPPRMFAISRLSERMQIKILRAIIPQLEKHTYV